MPVELDPPPTPNPVCALVGTVGGDGPDLLDGKDGAGGDRLNGGPGIDTFKYDRGDTTIR